MDLAKAVAIYLYEQSQPPGMRNERLLNATWQVIASVGEDARCYEQNKRVTIIRWIVPKGNN